MTQLEPPRPVLRFDARGALVGVALGALIFWLFVPRGAPAGGRASDAGDVVAMPSSRPAVTAARAPLRASARPSSARVQPVGGVDAAGSAQVTASVVLRPPRPPAVRVHPSSASLPSALPSSPVVVDHGF